MASFTVMLAVALVHFNLVEVKDIPLCSNTSTEQPTIQWECPASAVCGDELRTTHDLDNGKRCLNNTIVINCVCPGNKSCPVQNENHLIYYSETRLQYLCEPRCDFGMCTTYTTPAVEYVRLNLSSDHGYYKINCRCPGHNKPIATQPGVNKKSKSTTFYEKYTNRTANFEINYRNCSGDEPLPGADTVCGGSRARRGRLDLLGEEKDSWA